MVGFLHFNPRPPRGGRQIVVVLVDNPVGISTHALLAEGDTSASLEDAVTFISTHALLAEGDSCSRMSTAVGSIFQPTPSSRRATSKHPPSFEWTFPISTHALLAEGDCLFNFSIFIHIDFNPRPPRGGRLVSLPNFPGWAIFQPTPSSRRATLFWLSLTVHIAYISTHALLAEGDVVSLPNFPGWAIFQPTPSSRRATL